MQEFFSRTEVWHPLTVHFPIALLLGATFSLIVSFFIRREGRRHWRFASAGMLFAGCAGAWLAVYTGDLADGVVARKICDPTVLKDHENASLTMTWLFTAAAVLNVAVYTHFIREAWKNGLSLLICLLMLAGSGFLAYTGHLGATLVYEQAAGVRRPAADCSDFN